MGAKTILLVQLSILLVIGCIIGVSLMRPPSSPTSITEKFLNQSGQLLVDERCIVDGVPVLDTFNGGLMASSSTNDNGDGLTSCSFLSGSMVGVGKAGERESTTGQRLMACDGMGEKPYFDGQYIDSVAVSKNNKECIVKFKKDMKAEDAQKYSDSISMKRLGTDEANLNRLQSQLTNQEERNEVLRREISRIDSEIQDLKKK